MSHGSTLQTITIEELAKLSGLSLSTLRRRVADGSLPVIQPGGHRTRMLFLPDVLESLSRPRKAAADEALEANHESAALRGAHGHRDIARSGPMPRWQRRQARTSP